MQKAETPPFLFATINLIKRIIQMMFHIEHNMVLMYNIERFAIIWHFMTVFIFGGTNFGKRFG